jgi:hypothetical protein
MDTGKLQELVKANGEEEEQSAHTSARKPGVTQWLVNGIEMESEKYVQFISSPTRLINHIPRKQLREDLGEITEQSTLRQRESFDFKRKALNGRVMSFREGRDQYMGQCSEPDHPDIKLGQSAEPEDAELGLPSSYRPDTMKEAGLNRLAKLEADLRRAVCNDTLEAIRDLLAAKALTLKFKNENLRGEIRTTRAESALRAHSEKIYREQWRYNNSRDALIRLGATAEDLKIYRRLEKGDLKYLREFVEKDSRAPGQGHAALSWIWSFRTEVFADEEGWQAQGESLIWSIL